MKNILKKVKVGWVQWELGYGILLVLIAVLCMLVGFVLGRGTCECTVGEVHSQDLHEGVVGEVLADEKVVADDLYNLGMWHVDDYLENGVWSHDLSDGTTFGHRIHELQLNGHYSENLYRGSCNLSNAVELWNKSESHSQIMNNENNVNLVLIMTPTEDGECFIVATYKE